MFLKNVQGVHDGPDFESHSGVGGEVGQLFHLPLVQPHIGHIGIWMMTIGEWEHFGIFLQLRNPPFMFCQNGMESIFFKDKNPKFKCSTDCNADPDGDGDVHGDYGDVQNLNKILS